MRFSGFLKETPVCKKKTHHKNIQKSRAKGQKLAQSLLSSFKFFFSDDLFPKVVGSNKLATFSRWTDLFKGKRECINFCIGLEVLKTSGLVAAITLQQKLL